MLGKNRKFCVSDCFIDHNDHLKKEMDHLYVAFPSYSLDRFEIESSNFRISRFTPQCGKSFVPIRLRVAKLLTRLIRSKPEHILE